MSSAKEVLEDYLEQNAGLRTRLSHIQEKLRLLVGAIEVRESQMSDLLALYAALTEQYNSVKEMVHKSDIVLNDRENTIRLCENEANELNKAHVQDIKGRKEKEETLRRAVEDERSYFIGTLDRLSKQKLPADAEFGRMEAELKQKGQEYTELYEEFQNLTKVFKNASEEAEDREGELERLEDERDTLEQKSQTYEWRISRVKVDPAQLKEIDRLEEALAKKRGGLERLRKQLQDVNGVRDGYDRVILFSDGMRALQGMLYEVSAVALKLGERWTRVDHVIDDMLKQVLNGSSEKEQMDVVAKFLQDKDGGVVLEAVKNEVDAKLETESRDLQEKFENFEREYRKMVRVMDQAERRKAFGDDLRLIEDKIRSLLKTEEVAASEQYKNIAAIARSVSVMLRFNAEYARFRALCDALQGASKYYGEPPVSRPLLESKEYALRRVQRKIMNREGIFRNFTEKNDELRKVMAECSKSSYEKSKELTEMERDYHLLCEQVKLLQDQREQQEQKWQKHLEEVNKVCNPTRRVQCVQARIVKLERGLVGESGKKQVAETELERLNAGLVSLVEENRHIKEAITENRTKDVEPLVQLLKELQTEVKSIDDEYRRLDASVPPMMSILEENVPLDVCESSATAVAQVIAHATITEIENRQLRVLVNKYKTSAARNYKVSQVLREWPILSVDDIHQEEPFGNWVLPIDPELLQRRITLMHDILSKRTLL